MISPTYRSRPSSRPHQAPIVGSWRILAGLIFVFGLLLWRNSSSSTSSGKVVTTGIQLTHDTLLGIPLHDLTTAAISSSDAYEKAETTSRESTEATDVAAAAAAELVDTLDAARDAADQLRRVAAKAAHKKRVADRAAAVAAYHARKYKTPTPNSNGNVPMARERKIQLKDGSEASFSVFGRSDEDVSVFVLPFDTKRKRFTLIEEYHPGPNTKMIGLIAGMFEAKHGGSAEKAAIWELSEEARLKMGKSSKLVELAPEASGGFSQDKYSSAHFRPFLALDCEPDDRPRPRDREEDIEIHTDIAPDDLRTMIINGQLNMPSTAFAIMGLQTLEKQGLL